MDQHRCGGRARIDRVVAAVVGRGRGYYPAANLTPLDGLAYVTLQELATRISHRNTGAINPSARLHFIQPSRR